MGLPMGKPVLMDFYAEWCGPCHLQSPIIDKLKQKMGDQVEIRKIDVGYRLRTDTAVRRKI